MWDILKLMLIMIVVFGSAFFFINLRQIFKGGEFRGTCASNNPALRNQLGECTMCGKKVDTPCDLPDVKG
ncbi:MAG: hypothetical protein KDC04_05460 [Saprospiraceae bacterium]|nr:hypothetical protein [Saprospiraceae bacterium]MCB9309583.1 hypothetical protein [Lewinellaceae bacterium]